MSWLTTSTEDDGVHRPLICPRERVAVRRILSVRPCWASRSRVRATVDVSAVARLLSPAADVSTEEGTAVSLLGDVIRLSPELREEIRADPSTAYDRVTTFGEPERLELDWEWKLFAPLFALGGFRINPFLSGALFPDEETAFGARGDSRSLDPDQVGEVAAVLERTAFAALVPHLRDALVEHGTVRVDYEYGSSTYGQPLPPERIVTPTFSDERVESYRIQLAVRYGDLNDFYSAAARNGECTIFWAA
jgi:hypothetical protein